MRALLSLVGAALALAGSVTSAAGVTRCTVRDHAIAGIADSRVLAARGEVVVYRVRQPSFDTYWACSHDHSRRVLMGRDDSYARRYELYGPTKAFHEVRVAGDWVTAIHEEDNSPECGKYGETECEGRSTTLVIVNVARALSARANVYFPEPQTASWLLSPAGGVAWLSDSEDELDGCAAVVVKDVISCPAHTLWSGHVDPSSIRLSRTTLTWSAADGVHSAAL